jgi:hypothetical protein
MISPNMRVKEVDKKKPLRLPSASASKIERADCITARPSRIVMRSWLPFFLSGIHFLAIYPSYSSSFVS